MDQTENVSPELATEDWLSTARHEKSDETVKNYRSIARRWLEFCEKENINSMDEVDGRTLLQFKVWRAEEVALSTVAQNLSCLRVFFHYCQQVEIVPDGFVDKVPEVKVSSKARDEKVDQETAEAILDFLSRFRYASRQHAIFLLIWHTALRTGATRSLDLEDCHLDIEAPYLELHHRPEEDTPLKNREASEREVNLSHNVAEVLQDYTEHNRTDSMDEYGRDPLFTTKQGRVSHYAIANAVYGATRPCVYSDDCPHGRMREECEAGTNVGRASRCPSSHSGHPLRRGSITHAHLDRDVPREVTSDRCDVSVDVLEKHYARQSEERKREIRREYLDRG